MVAVTRLFVVVMREEVGLIMDGFTMVAVDTGWTKSASFGDRGKASAGEKQRSLKIAEEVFSVNAQIRFELQTFNSRAVA